MATAFRPADLGRSPACGDGRRWLRLALDVAARLQVGTLRIELPDGRSFSFEGPQGGPSGHLRLNRPRAVRRFATGGALGFSEAYLDGDWDSPELPRLLELFARNEASIADRYYASGWGGGWARWLPRLQHLLRPNTRRGSRRNILAHYDLGNAFYAAWLDAGMTYSAARFATPDQPLEQAQHHKYASLARALGIGPQDHVLEIGCGWGGFAAFAAAEIGARVTAVTISERQHAYASARIQQAGLGDRRW